MTETVLKSDPLAPEMPWYPLWLNDEWYIRVDSEGRCVGKCGEGALGFIVQLSSSNNPKAVQALKIPRLIAETERENAYIGALLSQELASVKNVFDQPGAKTGLVGARDTSGPFQRPLRIERLEEALEWNNSLIFVRFEKGQNPFFCLVKKDGSAHYPPAANAPPIDDALYEQIRNASREAPSLSGNQSKAWSQIVFVVQQATSDQKAGAGKNQAQVHQSDLPTIFNSLSALTPGEVAARRTWYTCIPTVTYDWAPNTLQESIGRGDRGGKWTIDEHLELVEQVCKGIQVLHKKNMLHADIRPANIVYLGDPKIPSNYVLSDYGSFARSNAQPVQSEVDAQQGNTITGPVVEGERVSPFYAPERGSSREREIADTAIVLSPGASPICLVIVGWKSEFIELGLLDEVATPKLTADEYLEFIEKRRNEYETRGGIEHALDTGDRIQLRDYVFELSSREEILGNILVFPCNQKYWTIYHGRIAISENRPRQDRFAFPIPRIIELREWSAATDIFSVGVLCLYSVYSELLTQKPFISQAVSEPPQPALPQILTTEPVPDAADSVDGMVGKEESQSTPTMFGNQKQEPLPATQTNSKSSSVKLDEDFEVMLKYLADKSLFNAVWPQLEWLRYQIEEKLGDDDRQNWTADTLANSEFVPKKELEVPQSEVETVGIAEAEKPALSNPQLGKRTIQSETVKVISQITSTVPGIEYLLRPLADDRNASPEYQLGPFVFFLHFVLCCLHRQDAMDTQKRKWVEEKWMTLPFCADRHEKPTDNAADRALERLEKIRSIIEAGALRGLKTEKNKIAQFDLRPENEIRSELNRLKEEQRMWVDGQRLLEQHKSKTAGLLKQYEKTVEDLVRNFDAALNSVKEVNPIKFATNRSMIIDEMSSKFSEALKNRPNPEEGT